LPYPPRALRNDFRMKRILMVAFHFPPFCAGSGVQRTLRFVQHLGQFNWQPSVLTVHPRAHENPRADLLKDIPSGVIVKRAFALDTQRHLSIARHYPAFLARPDRWANWQFDGIRAGLRMIRDLKPDVIWSTYPIATAHLIGQALHRRSGIPWVADFRDPMAQDGYPADPKTWASFKAIEDHAAHHARASVFTTPGAVKMYRARYPDIAPARFHLIENGYDESSFADLPLDAGALLPGQLTLLHSGLIYPVERDPAPLFAAIATLKQQGRIVPGRHALRLRAPHHEAHIQRLIARVGVGDIVHIAPPIPYRAALSEMLRADGLLLMQGADCNAQIPAKLYEYLRCRRPILGLTDTLGDTAATLRAAGLNAIAPMHDASAIAGQLDAFFTALSLGQGALPDANFVVQHARIELTRQFAALLDTIIS